MKGIKKFGAVALAFMLAMGAAVQTLPATTVVAAKKPAISATSITLEKGTKKTLKIKNIKASLKVKWTSADKSIATVSSKGVVKAVAKGKTYITAKVSGQTYKCKVSVVLPQLDAALYIAEMPYLGDYPVQALNAIGKVKWKSSDTSVIDLEVSGDNNEYCILNAVGIGTATITASCSGMRSDKTEVIVNSRGYYIRNYKTEDIDGTDAYFNIGTFNEAKLRETLTATAKENQAELGLTDEEIAEAIDATVEVFKKGYVKTLKVDLCYDPVVVKDVKWTSDDESVATVEDGVITAKSEGYAYIIASYTDVTGSLREDAIRVVVENKDDPMDGDLFGPYVKKGLYLSMVARYLEIGVKDEIPTTWVTGASAYLDGVEIYPEGYEGPSKIQWTSSDPSVFTIVEDETNAFGVTVQPVGKGRAYLIGTYEGQTFRHMVICR